MSLPGDVFAIEKIAFVDAQDYVWCTTVNEETIRSKRPLSFKEREGLEKKLQDNRKPLVVCVTANSPDDPISSFELESHFEAELIHHYYEKNGKVFTGKGKNIAHWVERFRDGARRFMAANADAPCSAAIRCNNPFSANTSQIPLRAFAKWKTLACEAWRLPVFAEKQAQWLPTDMNSHYFRSLEQYEYGFFIPACGNRLQGFPLQFTAEISRMDKTRQIVLVIHGFNRIRQWHYKFWKHAVCGAPSSAKITREYRQGSEERLLWQQKLTEVPEKDVFKDCREYKELTCRDCNHEQFSRVHSAAAGALKEYLQTAFTLLETAQTIEMKVGCYPQSDHRHRINMQCKDSANPLNGDCLNLGLSGVCYDWEAEQPAIHLAFQTLFFKPVASSFWGIDTRNDLFWKRSDIETWRFTHVLQQQ